MRKDVSRRWWGARVVAGLSLLAGAAALTFLLVSIVLASFNPIAGITLSDYDSEANADIISHFQVNAPDVNFSAVITFTPPEFGVASDDDVVDGTVVGELASTATAGLAMSACVIQIQPEFTLRDATTDTSNTFTYDPDTEPISDADWPGYDVLGSGNERGVDQYPAFLNTLFPGITPRARYWGHAYIATAVTHVALQFLVFDPGTNLPGLPSFDESWGYPSVTVLNDPTATLGPSSITDFCTTLISDNTVFGTAAGIPIRTNPQYGGTYVFRSWSRGLPDADGDGMENDIDTCPFDVNDGDIRCLVGQPCDGDEGETPLRDGIDSACDPGPLSPCGPGPEDDADARDCDNDGYENRGDNCPLDANGPAQDNQADGDEDSIGDACDGPGGSSPTRTIEEEIEIEGPAPPEGTATPAPTVVGTGTPTPTPAPGEATATPTATPPPGPEGICSFSFPATYNGLARLNGVPATGYVVTVEVGGEPWGSAVVEAGRYDVDVPDHPPATPPCFPPETGTALVFKINGATCTTTPETTTWSSGLNEVDLSCAAAATATPAPGTPTPGTPAPGTPAPGTPKPTVTPAKPPPSGGGGFGGDQDLPIWAMVLAGWAGLTALAGLGTLATRIAKR